MTPIKPHERKWGNIYFAKSIHYSRDDCFIKCRLLYEETAETDFQGVVVYSQSKHPGPTFSGDESFFEKFYIFYDTGCQDLDEVRMKYPEEFI